MTEIEMALSEALQKAGFVGMTIRIECGIRFMNDLELTKFLTFDMAGRLLDEFHVYGNCSIREDNIDYFIHKIGMRLMQKYGGNENESIE